jgi:hypothetical protein
MALSPRLPFLVLAAPRVGFVPFVVVGTARLCLADPFHFRLGQRLATSGRGPGGPFSRRAPAASIARCPWMARLAGHRLARRVSAAAVVVRPNGRHLALAGAVGLRASVVTLLDLTGTVAYLVGLHGAAELFH